MFYTYLWLRENGTPYYVGKGSGNRAFTKNEHRVCRPEDTERIIVQEHPSEGEAFEAEMFLIAFYGRLDQGSGCLSNLTNGGEDPPSHKGKKKSEEHKKKIGDAQRGPKGHWYGTTRPFVSKGKGRKQSQNHIAARVASRLLNYPRKEKPPLKLRGGWNKGAGKGYHWDKDINKFVVRLLVNGKIRRFGMFKIEQEAKVRVEEIRKGTHAST